MVVENDSYDVAQSVGVCKKRSTVDTQPVQMIVDEAQVIQIATEAFVKELGLDDDSVLKDGKIEIKDVPAGTFLMKEESQKVTVIYSDKKFHFLVIKLLKSL